ncbi:MAG: sigma-54-dependent Fis family transcriptional regulator [Candidatus Eisenbacteria bacterium]|nr:sigma-54-dependent Fis family transcriptional regulator [Candidatus Eisenbacteria bacterium]
MAKGETGIRSATRLLIVDDERSIRFGIGEWARDAGYEPIEASSGREALERVREQEVDAVVLDLKLGDMDGLQVLKRVREIDPEIPVVMLSAHATFDHVVQAVQSGAFWFLSKPLDNDALGALLERALETAKLRREVEEHRREKLQPLIGDSPSLKRALQRLEKAGMSGTATVLIHGETGSGKGLLARYLHAHSARAKGAFVELNCSAIPEQLLESELYGHEKGAFTDAKRFKKGLFELSDGGTLFLDEIGEMTPGLQAKLLHVLENRTFRRVGGDSDITVDVRVIAATHRDLKKAVSDGRFREDLYYRLNVVPIEVPPLRDRPEDIRALADHYVTWFCHDLGRPPARIHPQTLAALVAYAWPGNVRELKNTIERIVLLEAEDEVRPEHLPTEMHHPVAALAGADPFPTDAVRPLAEVEKMAIEHALRVCDGNKTRAAQQLGISRQTLRTKLKEYAILDDADEADPAV